jgi:predicted glutamine amidotransferase
MARMFGFIGNRADLGSRVLELNASVLRVRPKPGDNLGWGIGFYQAGEVLLRRRPIDERAIIDLAEAAANVRTDVMIGHVRHATVGPLRTENTHPFRYRSWLFAQTGTIVGFERLRDRLLESQPEFLRRNIRGDTDSEMFFYLFLSFLHDAGHLNDAHVAPEHVATAVRASISLVDRLSAEEGHAENRGDILVTNGEHMVAVHRNGTMAYRVVRGRQDVEELLGTESMRQARIPSIDSTHFTVIASELETTPVGWTLVDSPRIVTLTRTDDPVSEPL